MTRSPKKRLSVLLATILALALPPALQVTRGVAMAADSGVASSSAAAEPPVTFLAPGRAEGRPLFEGRAPQIDFGLYLRANVEPFELWSTRTSYADPIRTEWRSSHGTVVWPSTVLKSNFAGLRNFLHLKITDADGKAVQRIDASVCLNGLFRMFAVFPPFRAVPDAPATSPYPRDCPNSVFTQGAVQGIQAGWAAPLVFRAVPLDEGRYTVHASITPRFRALLGLSVADSHKTFPLVIGPPRFTVPGRSPGPATEHRADAPERVEPGAPSAGAPAGPMADLRSLPPFAISLNKKGTQLRFSATTWNAGDSPLVIEGFRDEREDHMRAYQYFYDAAGNETGHQQVGEMHFHGGNHQHWHFQDFARYRLLNVDGTVAATSGKQSWCLANTDAVDLTRPGAQWRPDLSTIDLSSACGGASALSIREVLAAGSGDTYAQSRTGQAIDVGDLPNGKYILSIEANPSGDLVESDTTNNVARRTVWLRGHGADRRLVVAPVGMVVEGNKLRP